MSESESDALSSAGIPADAELERGLRNAVAKIFKTGNPAELTVKRVRLATEQALGLEEGFFKGDADWKARSDTIIKDEAARQDELAEKGKEKKPPAVKKRAQARPTKPAKRPPAAQSEGTRKKRKKEPTPEPSDDLSKSSSGEEEDIKPVRRRGAATATSASKRQKSEESVDSPSEIGKNREETPASPPARPDEKEDAGSESEMSVLIDEEPAKPKRRSKAPSSPKIKKGKDKEKPGPRKRKEEPNVDPDQAEIKRLQGWLIKCGIRKMWARELAPYDSAKAKIKHLKQMLKDAGMDGRYSVEKAKQIKEERELRADLEVVQEEARKWGTARSDDEEEAQGGRPRRRLARGFKSLDFLDSDGEETD